MKTLTVLFFPLVLCCCMAAQVPQTSNKTPGQHNPDASPGSNLPQASTTGIPPKTAAPATSPKTDTKNEIDPFLDTPPLPKGDISLIGGTVRSVDKVRNKLTVQPFGGKPMKMFFDERTHIYRDGVETTFMAINKGERVYVDSQLDRNGIFARNVHVVTEAHAADARGQIIGVRGGFITLQDQLSGQPVNFEVTSATKVKSKTAAASTAALVPGALVTIQFSPGQQNRRVVREVAVLAKPGDSFKFFGDVTYLDLSKGKMAVHNIADDQTYELSFTPGALPAVNSLRIGSQVTVDAAFTGRGYHATTVTATEARVTQPQ